MKSPIVSFAIIVTLALGALNAVYGGSATWSMNPTSHDWNTAANWTPPTVPEHAHDVATFGISSQTSVLVTETIELDKIVFDASASAFTITSAALPKPFANVNMIGAGIINYSGINQTFVAQGSENGALGVGHIFFFNHSSAGS